MEIDVQPCAECGDPGLRVTETRSHFLGRAHRDYEAWTIICENPKCAQLVIADTLEQAVREWNDG